MKELKHKNLFKSPENLKQLKNNHYEARPLYFILTS